jgi:hypothetical protein
MQPEQASWRAVLGDISALITSFSEFCIVARWRTFLLMAVHTAVS